MSDKLFTLIQEFASLIDSILTDITLSENEQIEHQRLIHRLESFALSVKGETTLEESPVNQARSLFVQIYRMSLSRGRREVFFEKTEVIEREASKIPYVAALYLNKDELVMVAKATAYYESLIRHGIDLDAPIKRANQKLKNVLTKRQAFAIHRETLDVKSLKDELARLGANSLFVVGSDDPADGLAILFEQKDCEDSYSDEIDVVQTLASWQNLPDGSGSQKTWDAIVEK